MALRWFALGCSFMVAVCISAQEPQRDKYPRVDVAAVWEVDAKWPRKPDDLQWAAMTGVAIDGKDQIYLLTRSSAPVQVYDAEGNFVRVWPRKEGIPHQIRFDRDGHLWITDIGRHVVEQFTPEGKRLRTLGIPDQKGADAKHFDMPTDVAFGPNGDIYVADGYGNARIVQFDKQGTFIRSWGTLGHGPGQFSIPHSIVCDSKGTIYVADRNNVRIQIFDSQGKHLDEWRNVVTPWGLAIGKNDALWVCGSSPMRWSYEDSALGCPPKDQVVMMFAPTGRLMHLATFKKGLNGLERPGELNWVHCIGVDSKGNLYMGDIHGRKAQKFELKQPTK